jgi:DNA-binding NarL/FixJ family response regulator
MIVKTDIAGHGPPALCLIDNHALRRACMLNLLTPAALMAEVIAFGSTDELLAKAAGSGCEHGVILLSLGCLSITAASVQASVRQIQARLPGARLALLSDRDEPDEVVAAYQMGAHGFVPTSLEPAAALQALRMVLTGGMFYPDRPSWRFPRPSGLRTGGRSRKH